MKKLIFGIVLFLFIMTFAVAATANNQNEDFLHIQVCSDSFKTFVRIFNLPSSVEVIEDEAFEGTAITNIVLPENVTLIGERAFANINTLYSIRIPNATTTIAKTAFDGSNHVTITAAPNSYARTWAKENHLPFSPLTVMNAGTGSQSMTGSILLSSKEALDTESTKTQDTNRTWRKLEEIQLNDTIEIIANIVQGRAPPMA